MHELAVCQALLDEVTKIATSHGARAVEHITIEIGRLSGVEPGLLARAFEIARAETCAARATLSIEVLEITVHCTDCGAASPVQPNHLLCGTCGGYRTRGLEGDELRLRAVALEVPEAQAVPVG